MLTMSLAWRPNRSIVVEEIAEEMHAIPLVTREVEGPQADSRGATDC